MFRSLSTLELLSGVFNKLLLFEHSFLFFCELRVELILCDLLDFSGDGVFLL